MPRADFRLNGDVLDRQVPVRVLAVMCHPTNARRREEILRHAPPSVVVPRHPQAPGAPRDLWTGELWEKFALHRHTTTLAGTLALDLAQLSAFGQRGERRTLLPLAGTILKAWHNDQLALRRGILWTFVLPEGVTSKAVALPLSGSATEKGGFELPKPGATH